MSPKYILALVVALVFLAAASIADHHRPPHGPPHTVTTEEQLSSLNDKPQHRHWPPHKPPLTEPQSAPDWRKKPPGLNPDDQAENVEKDANKYKNELHHSHGPPTHGN